MERWEAGKLGSVPHLTPYSCCLMIFPSSPWVSTAGTWNTSTVPSGEAKMAWIDVSHFSQEFINPEMRGLSATGRASMDQEPSGVVCEDGSWKTAAVNNGWE